MESEKVNSNTDNWAIFVSQMKRRLSEGLTVPDKVSSINFKRSVRPSTLDVDHYEIFFSTAWRLHQRNYEHRANMNVYLWFRSGCKLKWNEGVCGTVDLTDERWSDWVCELVLESVKQLGWPGLPAEMTAVTGERSWGGGLTINITKPLWKFSVAFKLLCLTYGKRKHGGLCAVSRQFSVLMRVLVKKLSFILRDLLTQVCGLSPSYTHIHTHPPTHRWI